MANKSEDFLELSVFETQALLEHLWTSGAASHLVAMLWASPGMGKSWSVYAVAKKLGLKVYEFRLSIVDPIDVHGLPVRSEENPNRVQWLIPDNLPDPDDNTPCVIYIDELTQGMISVQNVMGQVFYDKRIGSYRLPKNAVVVSSANLMTDKAGTQPMPMQIANRLMHIHVRIDRDEAPLFASQQGWDPGIVALLKFRPDMVYDFNPKSDSKAFPTMRSWEFVDSFMKSKPELIGNSTITHAAVSGLVGPAAATQYFAIRDKYMNLPDVNKMLLNPDKAVIPTAPDERYALAVAIVRKLDSKNVTGFFPLVEKFPDEFAVMMVQDALAVYPEVDEAPGFDVWADRIGDIVL